MSLSDQLPATSAVQEPPFGGVIQRSGRGAAAWLSLSGELDLAAIERSAQLMDDAFTRARLIVVDLRQLTFMDSTGLRALVEAHGRARARARRLVLIRGPRQVDRLLKITELGDRLEITDLPPIQAAPPQSIAPITTACMPERLP